MRRFVFTIKDDVCSANGKDSAKQAELINVMKGYGDVEDYEAVLSSERTKYQAIIDNQTKQIESIKEQELTADDMKIVKIYRECKAINDAEHLAKINELVAQLEAVKAESEKRTAKIREILGE